ncbi:hypothetical protein ACFVWR_12400 [Leifsonia sp. NPDC058292]|uniref:hypothetical protein n=1 Tax=Leifsonia sp. NPDC058292 TaxID=3346428 RepID=UPI0036DB0ADE
MSRVGMSEFDRVRRIRAKVTTFVVLAVLAGAGAWLTAPFGIVLLTRGDAAGWLLATLGVVFVAVCITAIVVAVRTRIAPQSLPGKANPSFDETEPSQNPNGGYSTAGMQLGSH